MCVCGSVIAFVVVITVDVTVTFVFLEIFFLLFFSGDGNFCISFGTVCCYILAFMYFVAHLLLSVIELSVIIVVVKVCWVFGTEKKCGNISVTV